MGGWVERRKTQPDAGGTVGLTRGDWVGGWVGWVGEKVEEDEAVRMKCWTL